jgi:hypothetical protein
MKNSIYGLDVTINTYKATWTLVPSSSITPVNGLFDYGMGVFNDTKIVIYGGVTETKTKTQRERIFFSYNHLWFFDTATPNSTFTLVEWNVSGGGWSRIISLGRSLICVLNPNMEEQMVLLELSEMVSYPVVTENMPENLRRTGFGIAALNATDFFILGGYHQQGDLINSINPTALFYHLKFGNTIVKEVSSNEVIVVQKVEDVVVIGPLVSVVIAILFIYYIHSRASLKKKKIMFSQKREKELKEFNNALEEARINIENRAQSLAEDPDFTATLALPNQAILSVPGYRNRVFGVDFRVERPLAQGGMGSVSLGVLLKNEELIPETESLTVIIKQPFTQISAPLFLQELSIHEIFKDNMYFAKLICYSDDPQAIVLKYYRLGSLKNFIFPGKGDEEWKIFAYSFDPIHYIACKMTWALSLMHAKNLVHNDIKPDNILLDKDEKGVIFPVITDFGVVHVLDSADKVKSMKIVRLNAATRNYAAPEVLDCLKNHAADRFGKASDIFSVAIVCLELYTRKRAWEKFNEDKVINGALPTRKPEDLLGALKARRTIWTLIMKCLELNPGERPSLECLSDTLYKLDTNN